MVLSLLFGEQCGQKASSDTDTVKTGTVRKFAEAHGQALRSHFRRTSSATKWRTLERAITDSSSRLSNDVQPEKYFARAHGRTGIVVRVAVT